MLDECKNGKCACEQEDNFFHVKVIDQNSAKFSASAEEEKPFSTYEFESSAIIDKDALGREKFWEDMGRP